MLGQQQEYAIPTAATDTATTRHKIPDPERKRWTVTDWFSPNGGLCCVGHAAERPQKGSEERSQEGRLLGGLILPSLGGRCRGAPAHGVPSPPPGPTFLRDRCNGVIRAGAYPLTRGAKPHIGIRVITGYGRWLRHRELTRGQVMKLIGNPCGCLSSNIVGVTINSQSNC